MNLDIVRTFTAVVDHGSFAGAGRHLGLSPSVVTAHIQAFEHELGLALFDRRRRPSVLTEAGVQAAARSRALLAAADDLLAGVERGDEITGRLSLGAIGSVLVGVLPRMITAMRSRHPRLHIDVVSGFTETLLHLVDQRRVDAAFVSDYDGTERHLEWRPLVREPLVLIAPKSARDTDIHKLARTYPFIRYSPNASLGRLIDRALRQAKLQVRESMRLDWIDGIEAMVAHGHGISLVPDPAFPGPRRAGVKTLAFGSPTSHRTIGLVEPVSHAKRALTDMVAAEVRGLIRAAQDKSRGRVRG